MQGAYELCLAAVAEESASGTADWLPLLPVTAALLLAFRTEICREAIAWAENQADERAGGNLRSTEQRPHASHHAGCSD